jgi:hypothetical protein
VTGSAVQMCAVWPKAEVVHRYVSTLADRHGLVLYNPAVGTIDDAVAAFVGFATNEDAWKQRFRWRKMTF